jgi:hypothetical protein
MRSVLLALATLLACSLAVAASPSLLEAGQRYRLRPVCGPNKKGDKTKHVGYLLLPPKSGRIKAVTIKPVLPASVVEAARKAKAILEIMRKGDSQRRCKTGLKKLFTAQCDGQKEAKKLTLAFGASTVKEGKVPSPAVSVVVERASSPNLCNVSFDSNKLVVVQQGNQIKVNCSPDTAASNSICHNKPRDHTLAVMEPQGKHHTFSIPTAIPPPSGSAQSTRRLHLIVASAAIECVLLNIKTVQLSTEACA